MYTYIYTIYVHIAVFHFLHLIMSRSLRSPIRKYFYDYVSKFLLVKYYSV